MKLTEEDVEFETMKAGGPGGQNVNKRSTAVRLRVEIDELPLSEEERNFAREHLPPKNQTKSGEFIVTNAETRSQKRNRKKALEIANEELEKAIQKGRREEEEKKRKKRIRRSSRGGSGVEEDIREKQKKKFRSETTEDLIEKALREDPEEMKKFIEEEEEDEGENGEE